MARIELDAKSQKNLDNLIQKLEAFPGEVRREKQNFAIDTVEDAQVKAPYDTGNLRQNIKWVPTGTDDIRVTSAAPYSTFVEFGTRNTTAQPFFEPSVRKNLHLLIRRIKERFKLADK